MGSKKPMPAAVLNLTILFADISNSTRLYEVLGNQEAQEKVHLILDHLSRMIEECDGTVIKTLGDGVLASFGQPQDAIAAAAAMHSRVSRLALAFTDTDTIGIHVGIHHGEVIVDNGDTFGDAVNVASRMCSLAKRDQTFTNAQTLAAAGPGHCQSHFRFDDRVQGKAEVYQIFEIPWEDDQLTGLFKVAADKSQRQELLQLTYAGQTLDIGPDRPEISLGRGKHNDMVVNHPAVSRIHAKITWHPGRFVLQDLSTNGTFLRWPSGEIAFLRRDNHTLPREGVIFLGAEAEVNAPEALHFKMAH